MAEVARDDRSPTVGGSNTLSMDVEVVDGMVPKHEFDRAIEAAQQALRAKTASSQQMLAQASSAMRNALTALSLSEQEVANLKATVKELQERPAEGTNEIIEREREELRQAQQRVADLSSAFRQLQGEVARVRYEQEGFDMPVAMSLPVKNKTLRLGCLRSDKAKLEAPSLPKGLLLMNREWSLGIAPLRRAAARASVPAGPISF